MIKRADLWLAAVILLAAVLTLAAFSANRQTGGRVVVAVDGKEQASFPLSEDREEVIEAGGVNTLTIRDGKAWISSADCPDKICVRHRPVSKTGETIVCLPHRLVVRIEGKGEANDAVAE